VFKTILTDIFKDMQIKEKLIELEKELPKGSIKRISQNTGLRQNTIIDILKGRVDPNINSLEKIVPEVVKILKEQEEMKNLLLGL
jgi:predicted transcriptional regulator